MLQKAEETELQIRLIDILMGGKRLLTIVALNEAF
jgi:hypothetical protein